MSMQHVKAALCKVNWLAVCIVLLVGLLALSGHYLLAILYVLYLIFMELVAVRRTLVVASALLALMANKNDSKARE